MECCFTRCIGDAIFYNKCETVIYDIMMWSSFTMKLEKLTSCNVIKSFLFFTLNVQQWANISNLMPTFNRTIFDSYIAQNVRDENNWDIHVKNKCSNNYLDLFVIWWDCVALFYSFMTENSCKLSNTSFYIDITTEIYLC